jgi:hypothetical protein
MELVVLFGPPAVGKMSVGKALCEQTGFRLFHNHLLTEPLSAILDWETPEFKKLVKELRLRVLETAASSNIPGVVLTYVWAFDKPEDKEVIDALCNVRGVNASFVELKTSLETRLERNRHPERLAAKASKRDVAASEQRLRGYEVKHKLNTNDDFYYPDRYLCIENTDISVSETATRIGEYFHFPLKAAA